MDRDKLKEILQKHDNWLNDSEGGERADLSSADLRSADLSYANLRYADLSYANLRSANLSYADLSSADLRSANLSYADLRYADLSYANLSYADLRYADLSYANLSSANLSYADLSSANLSKSKIWSTTGNSNNIKSVQNDKYDICYTSEVMQIGCEQHDIKDWWKFTDSRIKSMDGSTALEWWKAWKPILRKMIKFNPAKATK